MKKTWTLLFEPLGVLMFRDHRSFNAGRDGVARSRFPYPSVFRGAIRSALFERAGADYRRPRFGLTGAIAELLGDDKTPEQFRTRGPLLARRRAKGGGLRASEVEYLFPWPADLGEARDGESFDVLGVRPSSVDARCFRWTTPERAPRMAEVEVGLPWASTDLDKPPATRRYLTETGGGRYAKTQVGSVALNPDTDFVSESCLLQTERRVGLARSTGAGGRSLTVGPGMLYTLFTHRLADRVRFAVELDVEGPSVSTLGRLVDGLQGCLVRLGGRSGHARLEIVDGSLLPNWAQSGLPPAGSATTAKLWSWTPALWSPSEQHPELDSGWGEALGDRIRLGGYDLRRRRARPLSGALDRGAVVRFRSPDPQRLHRSLAAWAATQDVPPGSYGYGHWSTHA